MLRWVTSGADKKTIGMVPIFVQPDLTQLTNFDVRTDNAKALADAKLAMSQYLSGGKAHVQAYSIAGRNIQFRSLAEIQALINHYQTEVNKEIAAGQMLSGSFGSSPGRIYTIM